MERALFKISTTIFKDIQTLFETIKCFKLNARVHQFFFYIFLVEKIKAQVYLNQGHCRPDLEVLFTFIPLKVFFSFFFFPRIVVSIL